MKYNKLWMAVLLLPFLHSCQKEQNQADAYGNFEAEETVISSQSVGELLRMEVEEGMRLKKDQEVGLVDTTDLHLQKLELVANRRVIETQSRNVVAQLDLARSEMDNLEREYARVKKLLADDAATPKQLDDIEGLMDVARSKQNLIRSSNPSIAAQVGALDAKLKLLDRQIQRSVIVNPQEGVVLSVMAHAHEVTGPGKPLYTLADLSSMDLRVYVSGEQLPGIQLGQKVSVLIDGAEASIDTLSGTISWISEEAEFTPKNIQTREERVAQVYAVKIKVPNDGRLKIGMPGEVLFAK